MSAKASDFVAPNLKREPAPWPRHPQNLECEAQRFPAHLEMALRIASDSDVSVECAGCGHHPEGSSGTAQVARCTASHGVGSQAVPVVPVAECSIPLT